ncbi:MAG: 6-carboxytetrahydropterin synthase [Nanoarchaeota archaeon]
MYRICKRLKFESSHRLWDNILSDEDNYKFFGKCANSPSHGHSYQVFITLEGNELRNGMLVNFTDIEKIAQREIIDKFDHRFVNDVMVGLTTAENMSKLFYDTLKPHFPQVQKVRVWETENSYAEYEENE